MSEQAKALSVAEVSNRVGAILKLLSDQPYHSSQAGWPSLGTRWQHYKGGQYLVIGMCRREHDGVPCVIYCSPADVQVHCRPVVEWFEQVEGQPRYAQCD